MFKKCKNHDTMECGIHATSVRQVGQSNFLVVVQERRASGFKK